MEPTDPLTSNAADVPTSNSIRNLYNRVKTKIKARSGSSQGPKTTPPPPPPARTKLAKCKTIAFHHAGYDPKQYNTVIFRLKGSKHYDGGVRASTVWMILWALLDTDTMLRLRFSHERGGAILTIIPQTTYLTHSDYYLHSPTPDDPNDLLYQFPLVPTFEVMEMAKPPPSFWVLHGDKSMEKTRSGFEQVRHPTGRELPTLCNNAVLARDKACIISGARGYHCERAYLIPYNKRGFWTEEKLVTCLGDRALKGDISNMIHAMNGITIRKDLHEAYKNGAFVFLPVSEYWVAHFFDPTSQLGKEFDQKPVRLSQEIPKMFLIVRIAIAAFELAKQFLEQDELSYSRTTGVANSAAPRGIPGGTPVAPWLMLGV
jgi:hypothetical protein